MKGNIKKYGMFAVMVFGSILVLNTAAKRFAPAAKVKAYIDNGV